MSNDVLGKGLKSLIPDDVEGNLKSKGNVMVVGVDNIGLGEHQPRKNMDKEKISELAQSIKEHGIIQPLVISKKEDGGYELIAGQRRLTAAKEAGLLEVPAILMDAKTEQRLEMALIENIQREDLDALEEAESYQTLVKKFNLSTEAVAKKVGKGETTIVNSIRLLSLPQEVKDALGGGLITSGHARAILTLPKEEQLKLLKEIVDRKLTVREVEARCKNFNLSKESASLKKTEEADLYLENISGELRDVLGTKVTIAKKGKGGRIFIDYYSKEELDRLIELLKSIKNYTEDEK